MSLSINKPTIPVYNFTLVENISENKTDKDLVEEILIQLLPNKNDEENSSFSKTDFKYLTKLVLYLLDNFSNNVELAVGMFSLKYNINMRLIIANFVDIVNNSNVQSEAKDFIFDKNDDSKINIIRKFIFYFQLLKAKKYPKSKIDSLIATSFPGDISMFKYDAIIDVFFNNYDLKNDDVYIQLKLIIMYIIKCIKAKRTPKLYEAFDMVSKNFNVTSNTVRNNVYKLFDSIYKNDILLTCEEHDVVKDCIFKMAERIIDLDFSNNRTTKLNLVLSNFKINPYATGYEPLKASVLKILELYDSTLEFSKLKNIFDYIDENNSSNDIFNKIRHLLNSTLNKNKSIDEIPAIFRYADDIKNSEFINGFCLGTRILEQNNNFNRENNRELIFDYLMFRLRIPCNLNGYYYIKVLVFEVLNEGIPKSVSLDSSWFTEILAKNEILIRPESFFSNIRNTLNRAYNKKNNNEEKRIVFSDYDYNDFMRFIDNCVTYIKDLEEEILCKDEIDLTNVFPDFFPNKKQMKKKSAERFNDDIYTRDELIIFILNDLGIGNEVMFRDAIIYILYLLDINSSEISFNDLCVFLARSYRIPIFDIRNKLGSILTEISNQLFKKNNSDIIEYINREINITDINILIIIAKYIKLHEDKNIRNKRKLKMIL